MGGPTALMSAGLRGMLANYAALQTTGHNIANAAVEGYSRQRAEFATASGQFTGAGFFGRGVNVQTVARSHSSMLTREANGARSLSAMDQARYAALQDLENVFPLGEQGVGQTMGRFLNALVDVASAPSEGASRQVVIARAGETAKRFATSAEQLDGVQVSLNEQLKDVVDTVNTLTSGIAEVNRRIAANQGLGHQPNNLLDERDRLESQLSQHVAVTTIPADDGTLGVFIAGGQRLVLNTNSSLLAVVSDPEDISRSAIAISDSGFVRVLPDGTLGGGALAGLMEFQNHDLVAARTQLGQMAAGFAQAINDQQALGLDMGNPPGSGVPIFATGGTLVVPNTGNERVALSGGWVAQVGLTVADATQLQASEYELRADPAGSPGVWQLTRRADGLVRSVADGDTVDGFTLSLGSPQPATTDRFLLQPVSRMASGMRAALTDPRGIAAASPVTASVAKANTGTATVASLRVVNTAIDPEQTASISFTSNAGDYNWELRDRTSNALLSSGSGTWTAGQPIALNGFELSLSGVPRNGDALSVAKTAFPGSNNGNALALVALRDADLLGRSLQINGQLGGGRSFSDAYAATLADVGVRTQGAKTSADISVVVANQTEQARASSSGVNLDEEAARLLAFQQSYQAAAKVLQVAQSVFDTLLQVAGGR